MRLHDEERCVPTQHPDAKPAKAGREPDETGSAREQHAAIEKVRANGDRGSSAIKGEDASIGAQPESLGRCALQFAAVQALAAMPTPLWLLDGSGRVAYANPAGSGIDADRDGLWIDRAGRPKAWRPADHAALLRLIASCLGSGAVLPDMCPLPVLVRRRLSKRALIVAAHPLVAAGGGKGAGVALFIADPDHVPDALEDMVRTLFGLTPAEARLASAIGQGVRAKDYGDANGLSLNTVRTHIRRVLDKTGTRSQAHLVCILAALAWNLPNASQRGRAPASGPDPAARR